jgi:hypothetical protein
MTAAAHPRLRPGCVYRTRDLARWSANPTRLAQRLVREGRLTRLQQGLYATTRPSPWGPVLPADRALVKGFLDGAPFLFTGSDRWNALNLGTTQVLATNLVYNTRRSGNFRLGGGPFWLRRRAFPRRPALEWFVVDMFENLPLLAVPGPDLSDALARALMRGRFDRERLLREARRFGSATTRHYVTAAVRKADTHVPA